MNGAGPPGGVIAVVRTGSTENALTIVRGLLLAGLPTVEVTMTVPDACAVIRTVSAGAGGRVGAGTVVSTVKAEAAVAAGAAFLVSPALDNQVMAIGQRAGVPVIPGVLTPSEIVRAGQLGAAAVKVFPISAVGGLQYLRAVLEPLPGTLVVASGGVEVEQVDDYLNAGAHAVCLGDALLDRDAVQAGDVEGVAEYAAQVMSRTGVGR